MTADLLRKAADCVRPDEMTSAVVLDRETAKALADWLEDIAAGWVWHPDDVETPDGWPLTLDESLDSHAVKVARLIVGEQP